MRSSSAQFDLSLSRPRSIDDSPTVEAVHELAQPGRPNQNSLSMGEAQLERPFREDSSRAANCWPYLPSYSRFAFPHGDVDDMLALQEPLQVIDAAHPRLVGLQQNDNASDSPLAERPTGGGPQKKTGAAKCSAGSSNGRARIIPVKQSNGDRGSPSGQAFKHLYR